MVVYPRATDFQGALFVGTWGEYKIPVYDVPNMHSLNQLVGYIKHINAGNGTVLYRGQCKLYERVIPSIKHDETKEEENVKRLNQAISGIINDGPCNSFFGLKNSDIAGWQLFQNLVVEAALQHYGANTYCVDFVDNHWTALWFGLYEMDKINMRYRIRENGFQGLEEENITKSDIVQKKPLPEEPTIETTVLSDNKMAELSEHAKKAPITFEEIVKKNKRAKFKGTHKKWEEECKCIKENNEMIEKMEKSDHLFLFLYVSDTNTPNINGVYLGEETYTIDLRKALPSTFLRPCSQHGWIVRGKDTGYDFNKNISCVIRVNIDLATEMLGTGTLLSQENFFPKATIDQGYSILLERQHGSGIQTKYKKILPEDMITVFK